MANTKKIRSDKKKAKTFSIKNKVLDVFLDYCEVNKIVPSNKVEDLIDQFNKTI
jgi:hypothetical protein